MSLEEIVYQLGAVLKDVADAKTFDDHIYYLNPNIPLPTWNSICLNPHKQMESETLKKIMTHYQNAGTTAFLRTPRPTNSQAHAKSVESNEVFLLKTGQKIHQVVGRIYESHDIKKHISIVQRAFDIKEDQIQVVTNLCQKVIEYLPSRILFYEYNNHIVGTSLNYSLGSNYELVTNFCIDPGFQGQGLTSKFLKAMTGLEENRNMIIDTMEVKFIHSLEKANITKLGSYDYIPAEALI